MSGLRYHLAFVCQREPASATLAQSHSEAVLELSNLNTDRALADAQVILGSGKSLVSDDRQKNTEQADVSIRNFRNSRSRSAHTLKVINVYVRTPIFINMSRCLSVLKTGEVACFPRPAGAARPVVEERPPILAGSQQQSRFPL